MPHLLQWLRYGWLPLVLLVGLAAQYLSLFDFRPLLTAQLSLALLAIPLVLGTFFKSSRVAFAAALILSAHVSITAGGRQELLPLCLGLASLNMALIAFSSDRSPLSVFGLLLLSVILGQGLALYLLEGCCAGFLVGGWSAAQLQLPLLDAGFRIGPAEILFAAAALLASLRVLVRPEQTAFGLLTCILLLFAAVSLGWTPQMAASAAGLLLTLLVLRSAYELAFRDELTGIPSRRAYSRYLLTLGRHFSIAVVDIDHFKKLNDRHGHQVGDQALRMVAGSIARFGGGRAFRYGGEEFVVVIRGRDREKAQQSLERMREKIADYPLRLRSPQRPKDSSRGRRSRGQGGGKVIKTTVSVGLASSGDDLKSPEQVLEAADRALYKAKRGGRNRVCVQGARR